MRKRLIALCLLMMLLGAVFCSAAASAENGQGLPYYISDAAGILTMEEWQGLEDSASQISERYGCGVYVVTLDDYRNYADGSGSFWSFSQAFYLNYGLGLGDTHTGILLILSMADRDYSILAYGEDAHYVFTDYGKEVLENSFLDNFRRNDWYGGFRDYVSGCGELLSRAAAGQPLDVEVSEREGSDGFLTVINVFVPLLTAFGVCQSMKRKMKPVRQKVTAGDYVVPGSIQLSQQRDVFLNRTVMRTRVPKETHSSGGRGGGGGGTTVNSGGFSGHSGKF